MRASIYQLLSYVMLVACLFTQSAHAQSAQQRDDILIADVSEENVAITTSFHGTQLLLFGALSGQKGDDIIIIISGPDSHIATRRKEKVSGIWINTESVIWKNAPSYYQIFSNRPLSDIISVSEQNRLKIGYKHLPLTTQPTSLSKEEVDGEWRDALARTMNDANLWHNHGDSVSVVRGALFRVDIPLPKNIRPGDYDVRVLHMRDGKLISEKFNVISVEKSGVGALIYRFAHDYSFFYGIFAVLFAVASGWLAAVAFRRS
ncbi:MAG: TIGR02186 family protein [Candidatus Puniceispirillaceae bacterium]